MCLDIKSAIKKHGLEIREVANRMGITPTGLSQHINGKMYKGQRVAPNPSLDVLERIASAIGCNVVELFTNETKNDTSVFLYGHVEYKGTVYTIKTREDLEKLIRIVE